MSDYHNLPYLFNALDKFYVNHITTRILTSQTKENKNKFINYLSKHYNLFSKEVLDKVLSLTHTYNYHLSKEEILGFVLAGSKYTREIFQKYNFTSEERLLILKNYQNTHNLEYCSLYGTYLIKGNKKVLINTEEEKILKPIVLSLKKDINVNNVKLFYIF